MRCKQPIHVWKNTHPPLPCERCRQEVRPLGSTQLLPVSFTLRLRWGKQLTDCMHTTMKFDLTTGPPKKGTNQPWTKTASRNQLFLFSLLCRASCYWNSKLTDTGFPNTSNTTNRSCTTLSTCKWLLWQQASITTSRDHITRRLYCQPKYPYVCTAMLEKRCRLKQH